MAPSQTSNASDAVVVTDGLDAGLGSADQLVDVFADRTADTKTVPDVDPTVALHYPDDDNSDLGGQVADNRDGQDTQDEVSIHGHESEGVQDDAEERTEPEMHEQSGAQQDIEAQSTGEAQVVDDGGVPDGLVDPDERITADVQIDEHETVVTVPDGKIDNHDEVVADEDVADSHIDDGDVNGTDDEGISDGQVQSAQHANGTSQAPVRGVASADGHPIENVESGAADHAEQTRSIEAQVEANKRSAESDEITPHEHVDGETRSEGDEQGQGDRGEQAHEQVGADGQETTEIRFTASQQISPQDHMPTEDQVDVEMEPNDRMANEEQSAAGVQVSLSNIGENGLPRSEQGIPTETRSADEAETERMEDVTGANAIQSTEPGHDQSQKAPAHLKPSREQMAAATAAASAAALAAAAVATTAPGSTVAAMPVAPGLPPGASGYPFPAIGPNGALVGPPLVSLPLPVGRRAVRIAPLGVLPLPPQGSTNLVPDASTRTGDVGEVGKGKRRGAASSATVVGAEGLTAEERTKQKRMLRNRESAARSRDKRKSRNIKLEQSIELHVNKKQRFEKEIESMEKVVELMKNISEKHNMALSG